MTQYSTIHFTKCYCAALAASALQCLRLGVMTAWREELSRSSGLSSEPIMDLATRDYQPPALAKAVVILRGRETVDMCLEMSMRMDVGIFRPILSERGARCM